MSPETDGDLSAFECGVLSPMEEMALSLLREIVSEMRASKAAADLSYFERALTAACALRIGGDRDLNSAIFEINSARFTLRVLPGPDERVEVSFMGGDPC